MMKSTNQKVAVDRQKEEETTKQLREVETGESTPFELLMVSTPFDIWVHACDVRCALTMFREDSGDGPWEELSAEFVLTLREDSRSGQDFCYLSFETGREVRSSRIRYPVSTRSRPTSSTGVQPSRR